jgi:hypothetical protein
MGAHKGMEIYPMSDEKKDLAYYQSNLDEMADLNLDEIEALGAASELQPTDDNTGDTHSSEAPGAAPEGEGDGTGDVAGVLAKDGKNMLPFSVLQGTREEKARLEQLVAAQTAEIERLKGGGDVASPGTMGEEGGEQSAAELSAEDLAAIEAEFPALGKLLRAQQDTIDRLSGEQAARASERAQQVGIEVQAIIDTKPKLAHLQATNPEAWADVVEIDNRMGASPKWANKPMADRFDAVIKVYEAENGAIAIPHEAANQDVDITQITKRKSASAHRGPTTLSDLPGGAVAPIDELASLEQSSAIELTRRFEDMTPEQLERFIASTG